MTNLPCTRTSPLLSRMSDTSTFLPSAAARPPPRSSNSVNLRRLLLNATSDKSLVPRLSQLLLRGLFFVPQGMVETITCTMTRVCLTRVCFHLGEDALRPCAPTRYTGQSYFYATCVYNLVAPTSEISIGEILPKKNKQSCTSCSKIISRMVGACIIVYKIYICCFE